MIGIIGTGLIFGAVHLFLINKGISKLEEQIDKCSVILYQCQQMLANSESKNTPPMDKVEIQTQCQGIVWSYGTGMLGSNEGELGIPHMVEDLGEGKLLIPEYTNCDVIILDKGTGRIMWQFGERGVAGAGTRLTAPHSAHQIPSGPYKGDILITEYLGEHRVLIVDYATREIAWEYSDLVAPLDAIYWDDEHIMVSDCIGNKIVKIRLSDKEIVWDYPVVRPFYLQKLIRQGPRRWEHGNSYGGDLLFGRVGGDVYEIDTSDRSVKWEFGKGGKRFPMLADALGCGVRAFRYGTGENESNMASPITIIADEANARILAVNRDKQVLWEIDGVSNQYYRPISWLIEPTYVTTSRNGNLLICDALANKVYELVYPPLPPLVESQGKFSTTMLSKDSLGAGEATSLGACGLISLRRATSLALTVECVYHNSATAGIAVHLYTSYNGANWDTVELKDSAGKPVFGDMPFTPGSTERKTVEIPHSAQFVKAVIENRDPSQTVSNIKVMATLER